MDRISLRYLLFLSGFVLLFFPFITVVNKPLLINGIPLLFWYIFGIWAIWIIATYFLTKK